MERTLAGGRTVADLVALMLDQCGEAEWVAKGRSMTPAIRHGQRVRLTPVTAEAFRPGQVVMAVLPGDHLVIHRIVRVDGDDLVLRGDARRRCDRRITTGDVVALVTPTPPRRWRGHLNRLLP